MASTINKKPMKDLEKDLQQKRKALQEFRFGMSGSRTRNVKAGRTLRRDIARILTEISARRKEGLSE